MANIIPDNFILLFVRIIFGIVFIYYGWPKVKDLKSNAGDFERMGFKPGMLWGAPVALFEFFGGIAILIGFYAELFALWFAFEMTLGTLWKHKAGKPFTDYSYDLQLLSLALLLIVFGGGEFALAPFNASFLLRWDVALLGIITAILMRYFSKPNIQT